MHDISSGLMLMNLLYLYLYGPLFTCSSGVQCRLDMGIEFGVNIYKIRQYFVFFFLSLHPLFVSTLYFLLAFFVLPCFVFVFLSFTIAVRHPSGFCSSSSFNANISLARLRFCSCDLEYWHVTTNPVGLCVSWTLLLLLLIFCPPGPLPPFKKASSISSSTISHFGLGGILFFFGIA